MNEIVDGKTLMALVPMKFDKRCQEAHRRAGWDGAVADPNSANTTVTMTSNKTVTANFGRTQFDLTMEVNETGWGTTDPAVGIHSYNSGDVVSILAQPATGYRFVNWTGNVANSTN